MLVEGHGAERAGLCGLPGLEVPVQPSVAGALHSRRRGLHVILRVEVGSGRIVRAARVNDRQIAAVPERLQWAEARIEAEESVEVECCSFTRFGTTDGDTRPRAVVLRLAVRHHHVQAVHGATLENRDELTRVATAPSGKRGAGQERRREAETHQGERAVLEENPS